MLERVVEMLPLRGVVTSGQRPGVELDGATLAGPNIALFKAPSGQTDPNRRLCLAFGIY
jgi:hypothetical protein